MNKLSFRAALAFVATAFAAAPVAAQVAVTTYHYDLNRSGWNSAETQLTRAKVTPSTFGLRNVVPLDEQVDAQPLLVPGVNIGGGLHDVVYVATENNTVYAIDASNGTVLRQRNLGTPVPSLLGCFNISNLVGISSTPVIGGQTLYVMAYVNGSGGPFYQLHALRLSDLSDQVTSQTVAGSHVQTNGTIFAFTTNQRQRSALLLVK